MRSSKLSKWGIWICAAWALALAILAFANLLLLSKAVELYSNQFGNQAQIWLIFILNVIFGLVFAVSTYGLWRHHNWGRLLFIWAIVIWSGFNILALFAPGILSASSRDYTTGQLATNGIRFAAGLFIPLWYLNLPRVKALFYNDG